MEHSYHPPPTKKRRTISDSPLGAEDGAQTRDPQLGRLMLYQLSYFRNSRLSSWAKMDSNHRRHKPADLQSAPFGHSGIRPSALSLKCGAKVYVYFINSKRNRPFLSPLPHILCLCCHGYPLPDPTLAAYRPSSTSRR